ncbi:MAG TPA: hypothetical protein VGN05_15060 [Parvibaculum sp.]|jgi:hypothetical protein
MKLTAMSRHIAAAVLLLGLAALPGCANEPPAAPQPTLGFTGKPLKLNIASVAVDDRYNPPGVAPNVEQLHSVTPSTIAQRWADTRIAAVGSRGLATLTVLDASVIESKLPVKGGLTGFFGDQTDTKITGRLRAELTVSLPGTQAGSYSTYKASVNASGDQTILQSANLNDRDRAYFELMQMIAQKFDASLTAEINRAMAPVIAR